MAPAPMASPPQIVPQPQPALKSISIQCDPSDEDVASRAFSHKVTREADRVIQQLHVFEQLHHRDRLEVRSMLVEHNSDQLVKILNYYSLDTLIHVFCCDTDHHPHSHPYNFTGARPAENSDETCVNTIRVLAADTVQKAESGHPGMPMGMAPVAHVLWSKFLKFNPNNPSWPNRTFSKWYLSLCFFSTTQASTCSKSTHTTQKLPPSLFQTRVGIYTIM